MNKKAPYATRFLHSLVLGVATVWLAACGSEPTAAVAQNPVNLSWPPPVEVTPAPEVTTVASLDLDRYIGTWYEVASIDQFFQAFCKAGVRADYAFKDDGNVRVANSCYDADGEVVEQIGTAGVADEQTNAKLSVSFVSDDPFALGAPYWVLYISEAYDLAVVGEPEREFGWVLSRTPAITQTQLDRAATVLARQGYDLEEFDLTDQAVYIDAPTDGDGS